MKLTKEQEMYQAVIQKAWEDENFKAALVANPVAAIETLTGKKLNIPAGKTLVVRDQTEADTVYINIPATQDNVELNEEQLETVSGGKDGQYKPFRDFTLSFEDGGAGSPAPVNYDWHNISNVK